MNMIMNGFVYNRLRQKCSYLETQNEILQTQLDETKEDKDSLVSHLTRKLSEQLTISKELEERLVGMQKAILPFIIIIIH